MVDADIGDVTFGGGSTKKKSGIVLRAHEAAVGATTAKTVICGMAGLAA